METDKPVPKHEDPQYLHAQIAVLRAMLFALADITTDPRAFQQRALEGLERLKVPLAAEPVSDAQLVAVHDMERLLEQMLG